ncbi:MAG: DUF4445 domain-containing protein [Deltaproteobacteria bacterium]|nr:DUF4445 domain-containing protein [Deltaproteobacteria bacterium]
MAFKYHSVTFLPENKVIRVEHLKTIFEAIGEDNPERIQLFFSCGAEGICRKCKVRSLQRMGPLTATEKGCLSPQELARGVRLACQARVVQDSQVEIQYKRPFTIALVDEHAGSQSVARLKKIVVKSGAGPYPEMPIVCAAAREAGLAVCTQVLETQVASCLTGVAGSSHALWTAVFLEERLIALEPGDTSGALYAAAVDLGTNTLQVALIDALRGRKIAVVTDTNPQIELGDTYDARLAMVAEDELNLEILHEEIILRIDLLLYELCMARGVDPQQIYEILVAGETGMLHLFLMKAPGPLEQHAAPSCPEGRLTAGQLDLRSSAQAGIALLPVIGAYAGADVTAAILATRLHRSETTALLLDLGSSSKAVLYHSGGLFASVAGPTPVFDGSGMMCGMRPETGAVSGVRMNAAGDIEIDVIGESLPRGICASGLIELAAVLREQGLLDAGGYFICDHDAGPAALLKRMVAGGGEQAVLLYSDPGEFATDICVTRADFYLLLTACRRVAAMLGHLCAQVGAVPEDLSRVFVSGALGGALPAHALTVLGIVPECLKERIIFIDNACRQGGQLALLDKAVADEADELARRVVCVPFTGIDMSPQGPECQI